MDSNLKSIVSKLISGFAVVLLFVSAMACALSFDKVNGSNTSKSIIKNDKINSTTTTKRQNAQYYNNECFKNFATTQGENVEYANFAMSKKKNVECENYATTSRGGVVLEASTRRVLVNENMNAKCFPASTTKVLTALTVLQNLPLDMNVKIAKEAVGVEGSSIYLVEGEVLTVRELLYGLMLRSGNDTAVALAIATSGSVDAFADLMNKTARECGAKSSNFVNPHGLHDDNHFATPLDLALITAKAYENSDFCKIVGTKSIKIKGKDGDRYLVNKNKLLSFFDGANGVKTGYTKKSGRCLVGGAKRGNMQLISVVFNYNDMWNDTMRMLKSAFSNFYMCPLENAMLPKEVQQKTAKKQQLLGDNQSNFTESKDTTADISITADISKSSEANSLNKTAKIIEICAKYDKFGEFVPYAYPIRLDGSEVIEIK